MSCRPHTTTLFAPLLAVALMAPTGHASIVNPSFEDTTAHPITDWVRVPTGWTIDTHPLGFPISGATEGWYLVTRPTHGQSMGVSFGGRLTQSVFLHAGDEILVDVAIEVDRSGTDGLLSVELVAPQVTLSTGVYVPWTAGLGTWTGTSRIDWQTLSLVVPTTGTYDLRLRGEFSGTGDGETCAFFDNIRVVPSPSAAAMLGLAGAFAGRRRR